MQNLNDLLDLANSLEWFELETDEQEQLAEIEASAASIQKQHPSGMYTASIWAHGFGGPYIETITVDTLDGLHQMIFDHYKDVVVQLALNEYK